MSCVNVPLDSDYAIVASDSDYGNCHLLQWHETGCVISDCCFAIAVVHEDGYANVVVVILTDVPPLCPCWS